MRLLVDQIRGQRPSLRVEAAYLDHCAPDLTTVVHRFAVQGVRDVVVVPLLLTSAYHALVDVPLAVSRASSRQPHLRVRTAPVLGTPPRLLDLLDRRLAQTATTHVDALVLMSAGSSSASANSAVEQLAAAWGERHGVPALAAFASSAPPAPSEAVRRLKRDGYHRIAAGSLFLAPGRLSDRAAELALEAGAIAVGEPLGATDVVADLVLERFARHLADIPIHAQDLAI